MQEVQEQCGAEVQEQDGAGGDLLKRDGLHGSQPLLPCPDLLAEQGVEQVLRLVLEGLGQAALEALPVHLQHRVQLGLRDVQLVDG